MENAAGKSKYATSATIWPVKPREWPWAGTKQADRRLEFNVENGSEIDGQTTKKAASPGAGAALLLGGMSHSLQLADAHCAVVEISPKACGKHNWRCMTHAKGAVFPEEYFSRCFHNDSSHLIQKAALNEGPRFSGHVASISAEDT
jgi:hypothetical protein